MNVIKLNKAQHRAELHRKKFNACFKLMYFIESWCVNNQQSLKISSTEIALFVRHLYNLRVNSDDVMLVGECLLPEIELKKGFICWIYFGDRTLPLREYKKFRDAYGLL